MTSRERLLCILDGTLPDRVPILFRAVHPLHHRWSTIVERAEVLLELGADDILTFGVPAPHHPHVTSELWQEPGEPYPILYKRYDTPAGPLRAAVQMTADWPVHDIPLYSDHAWARGVEYLVKGEDDLEALDCLLHDPQRGDLSGFLEMVQRLRREADRLGLLVCGSMNPAPLYAMGFLGGTRSILAGREEPALWSELLRRVQRWSRRGLELLLEAGVDLVYRSSCYETVDLFAPSDVRREFMPLLADDVQCCHQAGVRLHSFAQTGVMPFLDDYAAMGLDVLSSLDPRGPNAMDLAAVKARVGDRIGLIGGMDNREPFIDEPAERMEGHVRELLRTLAPGGRYAIQPAGMIFPAGREANVLAFIDAAKRYGRYPLALG